MAQDNGTTKDYAGYRRSNRNCPPPSPEAVAARAAAWYIERQRKQATDAPLITVYYWNFVKQNTTAHRYYCELIRRLEGFGKFRYHMLEPDAAGAAFGPVITN